MSTTKALSQKDSRRTSAKSSAKRRRPDWQKVRRSIPFCGDVDNDFWSFNEASRKKAQKFLSSKEEIYHKKVERSRIYKCPAYKRAIELRQWKAQISLMRTSDCSPMSMSKVMGQKCLYFRTYWEKKETWLVDSYEKHLILWDQYNCHCGQ